jgi:serine/threonine-protein kinase
VAAAGLAATLIMWAPWQSPAAIALKKLRANIGANASLNTFRGAAAILSPDATTLAFVAVLDGQSRLFIRKMDQLQAMALAGTEGAESPFFSPNGQWVAFFAGSTLKKVQVTGGAVVPLCEAPAGRGGTWTEDDTIIFTPATGLNVKLQRVPASGGEPEPLGGPEEAATTRRWPQILPGGTHVLFTEHTVPSDFDTANLVVASLSGGSSKVIVQAGYSGRYVRSGHLVFMRLGSLYAVPFDLERLETTGPAVPAVEGVSANAATGGVQFAAAEDGTLVYVPGAVVEGTIPIHWMTRDGKSSVLRKAGMGWAEPRFSPEGQRLALAVSDGKQEDIWVYEAARDTMTQLTFDPARDRTPVWSPTGDRILFSSNRASPNGPTNLYWTNADGTGQVTRLTDSPNMQVGFSWHPGGKFIFFQESNPTSGWDLMVLPIEGDAKQGWKPGKPTVFLATPTTELYPKISPDGRWIAYFEASSNLTDVFVRPFPGPGEKFRISTGGGYFPTWSEKTPELLFPVPATTMMMVSRYSVAGDSFRADTPQPWGAPPLGGLGQTDRYTLHPDGKRLVAAPVVGDPGAAQDEVVFFFNFFDYLRSIAPPRK